MSVYVWNQPKHQSLSYPVNTCGARAGKLWPTAYFQPAPGFIKQFYWKTATPIHYVLPVATLTLPQQNRAAPTEPGTQGWRCSRSSPSQHRPDKLRARAFPSEWGKQRFNIEPLIGNTTQCNQTATVNFTVYSCLHSQEWLSLLPCHYLHWRATGALIPSYLT